MSEKRGAIHISGVSSEDYFTYIWKYADSGEVFREFMHADDLADACVFLMKKHDYKDVGEFVNIGSGRDIKIKELAILIKEIVGFEGEIKHDLSKPEGTPRKLLDVSKIKKLGWEAKIGLMEGIRNTFDWYCS